MSDTDYIDKALEKKKEYEQLVNTYDPIYKDMLIGIEHVKEFIIINKLVLYGGSCIDYALRLRGDKIYPDDLIPDLDFYSPDNVKHAYQLADILYHLGYKEARAINASHIGSMRVDIVDNHWLADISYRPKEIFDKLPYLEYNGMRLLHPTYQRIDIHSSLSFPYDDAPKEVIFNRWSKDIKRFNKLDEHYPIIVDKEGLKLRPTTISYNLRSVLHGFAAYAAIYSEYAKSTKSKNSNIIPASFKYDPSGSQITFDTIDQTLELVNFDIDKAATAHNLTDIRKYESYANLMPERLECIIDKIQKIIIYSSRHKLLGVNSVSVNTKTLRIVNIQYLMKHFLSMHFMTVSKLSTTYLMYYKSLLEMIHEQPELEILQPSITVYGNDNVSLSREVALNRLYHELDDIPLYETPRNYYPSRSIPKGYSHPEFDPESIIFFRESGRLITENNEQTTKD